MEDKELLEKIIAKQSVIIPAMEKTGETKDIPEKLRHAMAASEKWADVIEKKEGRDKEARRWPVKQLAEEAHEHIAPFDHETRQQIQEYCELVARLPTMTTPARSVTAQLYIEEAARYRAASLYSAPLRIQPILFLFPINKSEVVDVLPRVRDVQTRIKPLDPFVKGRLGNSPLAILLFYLRLTKLLNVSLMLSQLFAFNEIDHHESYPRPAPSRRAGLASSRRARPCPRRCGRS
ncbi:MAG: hypothetical protein ACLSDQ_03750 [Adlercreutzia equolifaciens]